MNSKKKGDKLEDAVEQIESAILRVNPALKASKFIIERNKIFIKNGVKHEIDLYIKVDPGNDYDSLFIFECKNWDSKSVGKNEIIAFEEKIKVTNATKGFFISKNLGKYAVAQAKLNEKIVLLNADDTFVDINIFPKFAPAIFNDNKKRKANILVTQREVEDKKISREIKLESIILKGKKISQKDFLNKFLKIIEDEKISFESERLKVEGIYNFNHQKTFIFSPDELKINDFDISEIVVSLDFELEIIKPKVVSSFDVEDRGRFLSYELIKSNGEKLANMSLIAIK